MSSTRWNKTRARVNSDAYNDAADCQAEMDSILSIIQVATQSERDGLAALAPGGTLPNGTTVARTDLPGTPLQTWDGSHWWPEQLQPLQVSGWSIVGTIDVLAMGTYKRVIATLHINRTGGAFSTTAGSYTVIGGSGAQILPTDALSNNAPTFYQGGVQVDATVSPTVSHKGLLGLNGSAGSISFMPDASFTWAAGAFLDINFTYYI